MQLFALSAENKLDGPSLAWRLRVHTWPHFLFNRASSSYICVYHSELCSRLHLDVFLSPSSDFHDRILPVFKISKYFSWKNKMPQFKHVICFLWSIVNKMWVYRVYTLLHFYRASLPFQKWGCARISWCSMSVS